MPDTTDNASSKSKTLSEQVKKAMNKYFKALGDVKPANVYELVMSEVEPELLMSVMRFTKNNQSKAAAILGLNRATLRKKLHQYQIMEKL
jgi:Fis family transcriptional regulator|tara:strand:- start:47 stop:316 length:270 start_codon:yes stop_codon:yes gene_type:complete